MGSYRIRSSTCIKTIQITTIYTSNAGAGLV
ncbi:hypothetical protein Goshw_009276 [Gossypium schwendimanii]|uniref:Uncharacterized protein n=1 Tax=Gossypium schwendimanii TaxID=34291 RepID=A0A7J9NEZ1_GOSSC|nr:hypothetical protein [Gossypium schwendimanii]